MIGTRKTDGPSYDVTVAQSKTLVANRGHARLVGERWPGPDPTVVLLHAGVTDRRSWQAVVGGLDGRASVTSCDRRGFGETAASTESFSRKEDLLAVLDEVTRGPVWLVGSSAGGGIALDTAVAAPERVVGLVLLAPDVNGEPAPELDPSTAHLDRLLDQPIEVGDLDEMNRLEAWLWLDGPGQPEGRVGGPVRRLFLEMYSILLGNAVPEGAGASGIDSVSQLHQVSTPVIVACGDFDLSFVVEQSRELAQRAFSVDPRRGPPAATRKSHCRCRPHRRRPRQLELRVL